MDEEAWIIWHPDNPLKVPNKIFPSRAAAMEVAVDLCRAFPAVTFRVARIEAELRGGARIVEEFAPRPALTDRRALVA